MVSTNIYKSRNYQKGPCTCILWLLCVGMRCAAKKSRDTFADVGAALFRCIAWIIYVRKVESCRTENAVTISYLFCHEEVFCFCVIFNLYFFCKNKIFWFGSKKAGLSGRQNYTCSGLVQACIQMSLVIGIKEEKQFHLRKFDCLYLPVPQKR